MIMFILKLLAALVLIGLGLGFFRTWQVENSQNEKTFASGKQFTSKLDGFYKGGVSTPVKVTWLGKKFNSASSTGINIFEDGQGGQREGYPFNTSMATSGSSTVLNIDYDRPENPFWVRPILDQLVEVEPGNYLGKLTVRVVPGYPFSFGFFHLAK